MSSDEYFLDIVNTLSGHLENDDIISAQLLRTFDELKEYIINNKLGVWNSELEGFDRYE